MGEVKRYRPTLQKSGQTRTGYVAFMTDKADPRDSEWRGEDSREWVRYRDYAALQARIAELEARNAASERDAGRYRWLRDAHDYAFTGAGLWHVRDKDGNPIPTGKLDAAIDAHAQGQAGEE